MKRNSQVILVGLLALLPFCRAALAQRTYALGVGGGAAIPVGRFGDAQATGYNAQIVLAIGSAELPIGVRFDGIYNALPNNSSDPASADVRIAGGLFNLLFAFPGTSAKPYIIAGGGLYSIKSDVPGGKAKNDFGFNAGVGATFAFGPIAGFLESRYHTISRNATDGGVVQFVPITIGFLF